MKPLILCLLTAVPPPLYAQPGNAVPKAQEDTIGYVQYTSSPAGSLPLNDKTTTSSDTVPSQKNYSQAVSLDPKYGNLLNDDPRYNPKYPWYKPAGRIISANITNWAMDR